MSSSKLPGGFWKFNFSDSILLIILKLYQELICLSWSSNWGGRGQLILGTAYTVAYCQSGKSNTHSHFCCFLVVYRFSTVTATFSDSIIISFLRVVSPKTSHYCVIQPGETDSATAFLFLFPYNLPALSFTSLYKVFFFFFFLVYRIAAVRAHIPILHIVSSITVSLQLFFKASFNRFLLPLKWISSKLTFSVGAIDFSLPLVNGKELNNVGHRL